MNQSTLIRSVETWTWVVGFKGLYEVSSFGKIRRTVGPWSKFAEGKIREPSTHNGYNRYNLCKNGKVTSFQGGRIVLYAFVGAPPSKKYQANHIDYNPLNDRLDNLEWTTPRENILHSWNFNEHRNSTVNVLDISESR